MADSVVEAPERLGDPWVGSSPAVHEIGRVMARAVAFVAAPLASVMLLAGMATGVTGGTVFVLNGFAVSIGAAWIARSPARRMDWLFLFAALATLVGGVVGEDHFVLGSSLAIGTAEAVMFIILSRVSRANPVPLFLTFGVLGLALLEHSPDMSTLIGVGGALAASGAVWWAGDRFGADHRKRTERFHAMVDNAPSGMLLVSMEGPREILYANDRAGALLGGPLLGQPLGSVLDTEADGEAPTSKRGPVGHLEVLRASVPGSDVEVIHLRDLSEVRIALERVEASEDEYRTLFDRVPVGLYTTSPDGRILQGNKALADLLGIDDPGALRGREVADFYVDPRDRAEHSRQINALGSATAEYRIRTVDGEERWVRDHCSVAPAEHGPGSFFGEISDITEERLAKARLEDTLRAREQLIGAVSHELRTPLTAVLGLVRLLEAGEVSESEVSGVLDVVLSQTEDLHYIVEDLLVATRLSQGTFAGLREAFDVRSQALSVVDSIEYGDRDLEMAVPDGLIAMGDPQRVRQVLRNLLTNARKYGGDRVRVEGAVVGEQVEISVADSGSGLIEGHELEAFAPYTRLQDEAGDHGSLGLGLHLSRGLAEAMGGSLTYRHDGTWARFVLSLPTS